MKLLHSSLKRYIPEIKVDADEAARIFTEIGYMKDGEILEVSYEGNKDFLTDLEVRQNRVDCFGVQGLARDIAAYLNLDYKTPEYSELKDSDLPELPISIKAKEAVKRVMAVKLSNIKVSESPSWLKEYLAHYDINSINNLVDLTNYVMLETAHPSHAFDADISGDGLTWEINPSYKKMISLDGTEIELTKDSLVVSDGKTPLALAGLVGGDKAAMSKKSKNVIVEMAVYDGGLIRRNSREMKVFTEASSRLEKFMDPESLDEAFNMLINLILEYCGGELSSKIYENYLIKNERNEINVDLDKVQQIAGIEIGYDDSISYLEKLGFDIKEKNLPSIIVRRPINRLDIEQEEDVFEEIIRMYGYYSLPTDKLNVTLVKDVTPTHIKLIDSLKNFLVANGYDEIRSWPLVDEEKNSKGNFSETKAIRVQNSINEEVPIIRQSLSAGIVGQIQQYNKKFVGDIRIFEEGKVFYSIDGIYREHYSLAIATSNKSLKSIQEILEKVLGSNSVSIIKYSPSEIVPAYAHPKTCFNIIAGNNNNLSNIGVIYTFNKLEGIEGSYCEININEIDNLIQNRPEDLKSTIELLGKLVSLDSNIILKENDSLVDFIAEKIENNLENIWSWEIVDVYSSKGEIKYTVRVTYQNLSDQESKVLNEKLFS